MNARRMASIESKIRTPEFVCRIARLRQVVGAAGNDGIPVEQAAEILDLPPLLFRLIFAFEEASKVERRAERLVKASPQGAMQ
ncbi:hypothetical protein [Mesorhizobium sp. B2-3-5]|uniref:hypothetical protein n=1 Tax=Mesorhizobium sp. B2-3-5 TaxID=2589958 RepID=UPI00112846AD|nr:hypothetical protein [Mesorhizobium sp. B2-3-5]TPM15524.1 hypothetical protein FJ958_29675 [Mesorhizobium sp. B2-3-5]